MCFVGKSPSILERYKGPKFWRNVAWMATQILRCVTFYLPFAGISLALNQVKIYIILLVMTCWSLICYYAMLIMLLNKITLQVKWCGSVFPDPVSIVCQLLTESLEGMDPSLSSCLESYLQHRDSQLQTLIDVKQVCFLCSLILEKKLNDCQM